MPSGAKKRKAAKKKKEKGASNSSTQSHGPGDGDLKLSSPPITGDEIEKNKEHPSSVRSVDKIGEAIMDKVHKSSSSSSSRSSSSGSTGSSSDDESSNSIEKNIVMIESNDPSDLPEPLGEEEAAILEVTVTPSTVVPPIEEDHSSLENEVEKISSADQIDVDEVKEEGEACDCDNSVIDPSSTSINQDKKASLVEEEMGEEKYIVLEENTTDVITESKLKIDQSVSNTVETSFQEHKGKDHQSTSVAGSVERQQTENSPPKVLQRTSWASCCGLFELFSGTNR